MLGQSPLSDEQTNKQTIFLLASSSKKYKQHIMQLMDTKGRSR